MSVREAAAKSKVSRAKSVAAKPVKRQATKKPSSQGKHGNSRPNAPRSKSSASEKSAAPPTVTPAELSHRLHLLLHSIHQIERYEERLCSITDAIRRTGRLNASLRNDLQALIEELPSDEFLHDLHAVRSAVLS